MAKVKVTIDELEAILQEEGDGEPIEIPQPVGEEVQRGGMPGLTPESLRGLWALRNLGERELDRDDVAKEYKEVVGAAVEWIDLMSIYQEHRRVMPKLEAGLKV